MRVAYFTAGTVGAGHLVRGLAIGRALRRCGFTGTYRIFGPSLPYPSATHDDFVPVPVVAEELRVPARAAGSEIAAALRAFQPELLIVDVFWAPLRHILPLDGCECWLLIRTCPRKWFEGPADMPFEPRQFRRFVAIEPFRHPAIRERIDPIVVCNPDECRPANALREHLGVPADNRLVVVTHAGRPGEVEQLEREARNDSIVRLDLFAEGALFPLAEWLPGADRIYSAVGYNAFWEARWLGYAPRTTFFPVPRQIDDQAWRLNNCLGYPLQQNGADTIAAWISGR